MAKFSLSSLFGKSKGRIFDPVKDSAKAALIVLGEVEKELKDILATSVELMKTTPLKGFKNANKVESAISNAGKATKQLSTIEKERLKLTGRLKKANSDRIQSNVELKVQLQEQNKINKQLARQSLGLVGAYERQSKKLKVLKDKYRDVATAEGTNSKASRRLLKELRALDRQISRVDKKTGSFRSTLKGLPAQFGIVTAALGAGALGARELFRGIGQAIGVFKDFDKQSSNLEAVLGATNEQMKSLRAEAQILGATTAFTATQVLELETSFAKLGFPTSDILEMTESTLAAASAMGSDLGETAKLTGATLKAFSLPASEATRVNDVLAASTAKSALDFEKLSTSISTVAPVANKFGFSLEETTALIGELSNAGFDASKSATATRNILLNLADSNGKLAKSLKEPVKDLPSLVKGLKQLNDEGIDLGAALELTDKRSVAAFATFLDGTDKILDLSTALEGAAGTAERMAKVQLDNLSGDLTILNSAWEGLILSIEDGDGVIGSFLRGAIQGVTTLLGLVSGFNFEDINEQTFEAAVNAQKLASESENLLKQYEELTKDGVEPNAKEQAALDVIVLRLKDNLGDSVVEINKETGAFKLNTQAVRDQIKIKRLAADEEAATIASRLKGVQVAQEENKLLIAATTARLEAIAISDKESGLAEKRRQNAISLGRTGREINKLTEDEIKLDKIRGQQSQILLDARNKLLDLSEDEIDLKEKLEELNFTAADVELLFANAVDKSTKALANKKKEVDDVETALEELNRRIGETKEELLNQALAGDLNNDTFIEYLKLTRELTEAQDKLKNALEDSDTSIDTIFEGVVAGNVKVKEAIETIAVADTDKDLEEVKNRRIESTRDTLEGLEQVFENSSNKRLDALDREREATIRRQDQLLKRANEGVLNAQESLTTERAKQAKIELAQQREKEKAELTSVALEMVSSFIQAGFDPGTSLAQTGILLKTVPLLINSIPGFIEGTGSGTVADALGAPDRQGIDGYTINVDGSERIMNPSESGMIPKGMSNFEVASLAQAHSKGQSNNNTDSRLLNEVSKLNESIKNLPVYEGSDADMFNGVIKSVVRRGNNTETTLRKGGWLG